MHFCTTPYSVGENKKKQLHLQHERRDIGWGNLWEVLERYAYMGFSSWYTVDTICALVPKFDSYPKMRVLVLPFDDYTWICLIVSMFTLSLMFLFTSNFELVYR